MDLLVAVNPDADSRLPYLLWVPLGTGLVFRTSGTWPRTKALYCHPVPLTEWPAEPELVETVPLRSCRRRGAAVDIVAARGRENRSQLVFTTARGREVVFWQTPRTRKQARPGVRTPTARAAGIAQLPIVIDVHERYGYDFTGKPVHTVRRGLPCGDYGLLVGDKLIAAVERKSLPDLVSSLLDGTLKYQLTELSALPRAAVVVEDRYSQVFTLTRVRPSVAADAVAELQVAFPTVPIVFCETRQLAQEYTYRFLAAAHTWAGDTSHTQDLFGADHDLAAAPTAPEPSTAEVRAWARRSGLDVPDRGRLRPEIWQSWRQAHPPESHPDQTD
ncbi:MAG TPA: ERCC4 domain-containing protein [Pseudonocardiaceae bacterium]